MKLAAWPIKLNNPPEALGCMHCAAFMARTGAAEENALQRMFRWWNDAFILDAFTPENFAYHFTEDAILVVNGIVEARGLDALAAHAQSLRATWETVRIELPLDETFVSGENVFGHYRRRTVDGDDHRLEAVMASVKTRIGRITFLNAISHSLG